MDYSKKSTYLFSIDALRVISILAVILIHTTTKTLANLDHNIIDGAFSLFLNQASRFAVPLFFLISGFVLELNSKDLPYLTYFKKRASRVILPFVFWSMLYFMIGWGFNVSKIFSLQFGKILLAGAASYHLYFIPTLVIFYVAFPLLHNTLHFFRKPLVFIALWIIQILLLSFDYYVHSLRIDPNIRIVLLVGAMFVTGIIASHIKDKIFAFTKIHFKWLTTITVATLLLVFFHVAALSIIKKTTSFIYNQHGPLTYAYTLLGALITASLLERTQFARKYFIQLSKLSLFVFFIHVMVLDFVWNNFVRNTVITNGNWILKQLWFDPLFFISVASASFGIAYFIHKIPYASKLTG
jgi:surface polysaccharide O-acyltransferase-like enzyme